MNAVEVNKKEIQHLPPSELSEFRREFTEFEADDWDMQIEKDAADGKLDFLAEEAIKEYFAGKVKEI